MTITESSGNQRAKRPAPFGEHSWDNGQWGIQPWLERTAWKTLKGTNYGRGTEGAEPHPALFEDPLLRQVYLMDLAIFIGAEQTSYRAVSGMMGFAPDELSEMQLGTQVLDECRHFEVFCKRMTDLGVSTEKRSELVRRHTTPAMRSFYDLILEQVDKRDFFAASIAQNLILEGMAYPVYRYEIKYWSRFDPELSRTIKGAFADEVHHVGFGEAINRDRVRSGSVQERNTIARLVRDFHQLMTAVFEEIIKYYVGLYQQCANQYVALVGDVEIFPGRRLAELSEEDQTRLLLAEIQGEHRDRLLRLGISAQELA